MKNEPVKMIRYDMNGIPVYTLPEDFSIRTYEPGDENFWVELQKHADKLNKIDLELFHKSFGYDEGVLAQRMFFLLDYDKKIIGSAAAWFNDDYHGERYGRIHWVAIHPEHQGKGLSKPLLSAACERLVSLGYRKAYLSTSSARIPAIKLYLKFGFLPEILNSEDETVWNTIMRACN